MLFYHSIREVTTGPSPQMPLKSPIVFLTANTSQLKPTCRPWDPVGVRRESPCTDAHKQINVKIYNLSECRVTAWEAAAVIIRVFTQELAEAKH